MAKVKVGIKRKKDGLYEITKVIFPLDWKDKLEYVFIGDNVNNLPAEFKHMSKDKSINNSIYIDVTEDQIYETTKKKLAIRGLDENSFSFIMRGQVDWDYKVFDADLAQQYFELAKGCESWKKTEDVVYSDINSDKSWNAQREYEQDRLTKYIVQKRYAYCAVYYEMFRKLFEILANKGDNGINLHIVSVGTGSKTDAISLKYAVEDYPDIFNKTKFIGIDVEEWTKNEFLAYFALDDEYYTLESYDEYIKSNSESQKTASEFFVEKDIEMFQNEIAKSIEAFEDGTEGQNNVYILVFPNMLSEIDGVEELLDEIKKVYEGKKTYILASKNPSSIDDNQMAALASKCAEPLVEYEASEEGRIWEAMEAYNEKTGNVGRQIKRINEELGSDSNDDCEQDSKKPICKMKYVRYKVMPLFDED